MIRMGVSKPGYQLLTLSNPDPTQPPAAQQETIATTSCLLPDQIGLYLHVYVPCIVLTLAFILFRHIYRFRKTIRRTTSVRTNRLPSHMTSISRSYGHKSTDSRSSQVVYSDSDPDSDPEDLYSPYPATPTSGPDYNYSYHTDENGTPAAAASPFSGFGGGRPKRPERLTRRVSRVYLWDGRGKSGHVDGGGAMSSYNLGPLGRFVVRPTVRLLRRAWQWTPGPAIGRFWVRSGCHEVSVAVLLEIWGVVWVALLLYLGVWLKYML